MFYSIGAFSQETHFLREQQQQLKLLAQLAERFVMRMDTSSKSACKCALGMINAAEALSLPLPPSCLKALHDLVVTTPTAGASVDTRLLAAGLYSLVKLGYRVTPNELALWCDQLMTTWRSNPRSNEAFSWLVAALHSTQLSPVPQEVKVELITVAARPSGWTPAAADRIVGAARAWKVPLPKDAAARLTRMAASRRTKRGQVLSP